MNAARKKGQVYIGAIIAIGVLSILGTAIITLVSKSYELISFTRSRTNARHLASEQIETIRNLSFDDVGTVGGIPSGTLPQNQTVSLNGLTYTILISVVYVDDPFDGTAPTDLLPNDYKRARVDVSWGGVAASNANTITLITDIAPQGIETTVGGGTLSILVFDALGVPVPQADVRIVASSVNPPIDLNLQTDNNGRVILPGAPPCDSCYEVTASKAGFSTERTYSTTEIANPNKPHLTMIEGELIQASFTIDLYSSLNLFSVNDIDNNFAPLANQIIHLRGNNKVLGFDALDQPIYKFDQDVVTDSAGTLTIEEFEWDNYSVTMPSDATRQISASNPLIPLLVNPNETINFTVALTPESNNSLLVIFQDQSQNLVSTVSATLTDGGSYNETVISGDSGTVNFGQAYFSGLNPITYTLNATASGFLDYNGTTDISGYTTETIILEPQ